MSENESSNSLVIVTQSSVDELKKQRALLKKFVQSQLVEASFSKEAEQNGSYGEGDYGTIPGTKKRTLFKPGAEKLMRLFNLGSRMRLADKEVDRVANIAIYTYKCEIYSLRKPDVVISDCEGTANSQEEKFKERTKWRTNPNGGRESTKIETPIFDILNNLQKMAQKRALIGAVIIATGASEFFTQDMLDDAEEVRPEPKDVTPAPQEQQSAPKDVPECCGQPMMISKYVDKEMGHKPFYCMKCRSKKPAENVA